MDTLPIVAIVGRANVGKSSIFNAILHRREAIVARESGTTRDSVIAKAEWNRQHFWLVDTAGLKDPDDDFEFTIQEQIQQAADSADVIVVVVEATTTITEEDRKVAAMALKTKKPVFLVINKIDQASGNDLTYFQRLGIKDRFLTSTTQSRGISELLDAIIKKIPKKIAKEPRQIIKVALVGRPNVGKSYLFNTLAKKQQAIVSQKAGTTRDVNRIQIKFKNHTVELLDTAGIRRSGKIGIGIEHFSVLRTLNAIEQADIAFLIMTVDELNVQLDQKIAGMVKESGKGLILVISKWDIKTEDVSQSRESLISSIARTFDFVPWAPLVFTSAVTGQNVTKLFDLTLEIYKRRQQKTTTPDLNRWLQETIAKHPPAGLKNRSPKLNYMVQETDNPIPAFKIFGSQTKYLHWSYKRFLERQFRERYDFSGSPIQFWFIEKHQAHSHGNSPTKLSRKGH